MKLSAIASRYFKARFVSWITVSQQPVMLPTIDGSGCVLAVFQNGKYIDPTIVHVPNGVPADWGPDGPIHPSQQPPPEGGTDDTPPSPEQP